MNQKQTGIVISILIIFSSVIFLTSQGVQSQKTRDVPTFAVTTSYIPNPPSYYFELPDNLRNFLEQLYLTVYFFHLPSNLSNLLEGLVTVTPTPIASLSPTRGSNPTATKTPTKTPTPTQHLGQATPTMTPQATTAPSGSAGLHMSGVTMMTANNQRFVVKGVNMEFYRDNGCSYVTEKQYPLRTQIAAKMASLRINAVRLNMSLGWLGQNSTNLNQFLDMMQALADKGIYSMPSDHSYTGKSLSGSNASYTLFKNIIEGARSRGIEKYLIMNPYNEPYGNSVNWAEWVTQNKNTLTYLRNTAQFKGIVVLDTPSWAAQTDRSSGLSNYKAVQQHDASLLGSSNIVFSNHWYPNISIGPGEWPDQSYVKESIAVANQVPVVIGELGQYNATPDTPQYVKDVSNLVLAAIPNGHNGIFPWIWGWCDSNNMTKAWDNYTDLSTYGQLVVDSYLSKAP